MHKPPLQASSSLIPKIRICSIRLHSFNAFEERKPNFDLWLSRVVFPVHGYRPKKKPQSCKDTKIATPLDFCRDMCRHVITRDETCGEHVSM